MRKLLWCILAVSHACASETVFSVHDDVLAYPQYEVEFSGTYISEVDAFRKLGKATKGSRFPSGDQPQGELFDYRAAGYQEDYGESSDLVEDYERLLLKGRPYLCSLPRISESAEEEPPEATSKADQEKDLVSAADRGWELLEDLKGTCMFFYSGWWSYSFCYGALIKQFHRLPPGSGGPTYPPREDPSTPSYVLGRYKDEIDVAEGKANTPTTTELQTKGEARYLVQKLGGGTTCDLTGRDRRIEVEFHCHPQSTDRIGWIKEVATCTYLMIVYTPRLCNDVAFLPPRQNKAHVISCSEILKPDEVAEWNLNKATDTARNLIGGGREEVLMAGTVEIGAMKEVGREGRRIQKGRVVSPPDEKVEMLAVQKNGKLQKLSKEELRKLDVNPDTVEAFRKKIQDRAGIKDWKVEKIEDDRGVTQLRGIIADDGDEGHDDDSKNPNAEGGNEGSDEAYKEEF